MRITLSMLCIFTVLEISATGAGARGGAGAVGGQPTPHVSNQGLANTNGPLSADRDKGLARAEDRHTAHRLAHQKATKKAHHPKHKQPH